MSLAAPRQSDVRGDYDADKADAIIDAIGARPEMLVQILHGLNDTFGFVPEEAIRQLAERLNISRADVHGVVSYYHDFNTQPRGKHVVRICQAEACQAMGSRALTEHAEGVLGQAMHDTRDDVTLEPVYCLGNCALAPAIEVDKKTYGRVSPKRFDELLGALDGDER